MIGLSDIETILSKITYKPGWRFRAMQKGDGFLVQVVFEAIDIDDGVIKPQHSRKWYVSSHSTPTEVVRTVFKALEAAELHELQENFLYDGVRIHDPHISLDVLKRAAHLSRFDDSGVRKPPEPSNE